MRPLALAAVCLSLAACHPPDYSLELAKVEHTPLPFDPTDEYEIGRWWFNGEQLLRLEANGAYALYPGSNRYRPPAERGFWSKQSFAELRFAPYQASPEWNRVAVTKEDGAIVLHVPRLDPMRQIPGPPQVAEDQLVGIWVGGGATLRLKEDGRFMFTPPPASATGGAPSIAIGHGGAWRVVGDRARLFPDPPNLDAYDAVIERDRESRGIVALEAGTGTFRRASDAFVAD